MVLDGHIGLMLDDEYVKTLKAVSEAQAGSEEAKWQLQKLNDLHKQRMSEEQTARESYIKTEELAAKKEQLEAAKSDRIVKIVLESSAIVVPCAVSSYWMAKGMIFEQTGTFVSRATKWVSENLRLFKK